METEFPLMSDCLSAFLMVGEEQSFTGAARRMGVTQSAVTKMVKRLEDALEADLFDRSRRPIALTEEGCILMKEAVRCRERLATTVGSVRGHSYLKPVLRLGAVESLSKCFLPRFIQSAQTQASHVHAVTGSSLTLIEALVRRDIDYAFVSDAFTEIRGLRREQVFCEESVLLLPKGLADQNGTWTWDRLKLLGIPYLQYEHEGGGGRLNDSYLNAVSMTIPNRIEVDSSGTMLGLVALGVGWTVARTVSVLQNPELIDGLVVLPLPPPALNRPIYLTTRGDDEDARIAELADLARTIFSRQLKPRLMEIAPWLADEKPAYPEKR